MLSLSQLVIISYVLRLVEALFYYFIMRTASVMVPALLLLQPSVHIKEEHAEQWTAEDPATNGCIVIVENDPEPGAASGRFSFNGANEQVEEQKASCCTSDLKAAACPCHI